MILSMPSNPAKSADNILSTYWWSNCHETHRFILRKVLNFTDSAAISCPFKKALDSH